MPGEAAGAGMLAFAHALNRQIMHFFERVVGQFTSVSFHAGLK